ncbi:MAG TPA: DUF402 domain-containing protein [Myxococcaceae bacterium]|nr:DUF402 domain-containing protein [Myxococcaceae bacterium]
MESHRIESYRIGQEIVIDHGKPWQAGKPIRMPGRVTACEGERLVLTRKFRNPGIAYDGLYAVQHPGDYGTVEVHRGGWVCRRRYFRHNGELIGEQFNINTPVEFHRGEVRYTDLEIDVALLPGRVREVEIQDASELTRRVASGAIPHVLGRLAARLAEELARRLAAWDGVSELEWDVRPEDLPPEELLEPSGRADQMSSPMW